MDATNQAKGGQDGRQLSFFAGDVKWDEESVAALPKGQAAVLKALRGAGLSPRFWEAFEELIKLGYNPQQAAAGAFYVVGRKGRGGLPMEKLGLLIGKTRQWVNQQMNPRGQLHAKVMQLQGQFWADKVSDLDERMYERVMKSNKATAADFRLAYERAGVMTEKQGEDAHSALLKMLSVDG